MAWKGNSLRLAYASHLPVEGRLMVSLFRSGCTECPPTSVGDLFCQIVAVLFGMLLLFVWTVGVAKRREGLKKQHSVLFFPERDRAAVRPPVPTRLVWSWDGCKTKAFPSGEGGRKKPSAFSRWMRRPKSAHTNAFLPSPS